MPSVAGLSLVGFIEEEKQAIEYLEHRCIIAGCSNRNSRIKFWKEAKGKLGSANPMAGFPEVRSFPSGYEALEKSIRSNPRFQEEIEKKYLSCEFKEVEIDKLLAFQRDVDISPLGSEDPIRLCLPETIPETPSTASEIPAKDLPKGMKLGIRIESAHLNLRVVALGGAQSEVPSIKIGGVIFGTGLPWAQVISFQDWCFLSNGYHRAFWLRKQGQTHIPCLFLKSPSLRLVGIEEGKTLSKDLFFTKNKPTFGHFSQGRAASVQLRMMDRVIEMTCREFSRPRL